MIFELCVEKSSWIEVSMKVLHSTLLSRWLVIMSIDTCTVKEGPLIFDELSSLSKTIIMEYKHIIT